jgi:ribosomal-protein-alanine N-acetyltransferase
VSDIFHFTNRIVGTIGCRRISETDFSDPAFPQDPLAWSIEQIRASYRAGHICIALEADNAIHGYGIFSQVLDELELLMICIAKEHRSKGLASDFLRRSCEYFSYSVKTVFLEVRASNSAAITLYKKIGFAEQGLRKHYYPASEPDAPREHAILMAKNLEDVN